MSGITRRQVVEAWDTAERLQETFEKLHPNSVRYQRAREIQWRVERLIHYDHKIERIGVGLANNGNLQARHLR